jgi:hypothetical protein
MLAVCGPSRATLRCADVDVGVSLALGGAVVGGPVGRPIRVQWLVSTLGEIVSPLCSSFCLPLQSEANGEPALSPCSSP